MKYYTVFHLNLMFSSIEVEQHKKVIETCYWPLLRLAEKGYPIGIECTGITLKLIEAVDPDWIAAFRATLERNEVELVGSGYSQIIQPLVPAEVNRHNQIMGMELYDRMLGVRPKLAFINELAYSAGMVEHYLEAGYAAIMMEWNNPYRFHPEWPREWRYYPQLVQGTTWSIPVIWADSILFQKFQRYAHSWHEMEDLISYLPDEDKGQYIPLYANDAEIFDFRPGRYRTEEKIEGANEWLRIETLLERLQANDKMEFILPYEAIAGLDHEFGGNLISLESTGQPIPVKKQEKYNINRWALTGRDDLAINTACYQIYYGMQLGDATQSDWEELCIAWSSDYRTHITDKRWKKFRHTLAGLVSRWVDPDPKPNVTLVDQSRPSNSDDHRIEETDRSVRLISSTLSVELEKRSNLAIKSCSSTDIGNFSLFGTLEHGYYDDISLGADFYSAHTVIEQPGSHKVADLNGGSWTMVSDADGAAVKATFRHGEIIIEKRLAVYQDTLIIEKTILLPSRDYGTIRAAHFTLNPEAWNKESLSILTHNGGYSADRFQLGSARINHSDILSSLISARHGMGATEGLLIVSDEEKSLLIRHDTRISALIPNLIYHPEASPSYFLRIQYSAQESDETFRTDDQPVEIKARWEIKIAPGIYPLQN